MKCLLMTFLEASLGDFMLLSHWQELSYLATFCCSESRMVNIDDFFGIVFDLLVSSGVPLKILMLRSM